MAAGAMAIERGCGTRKAGGVYAELGMVERGGLPLEAFLIDPPRPVDGLSGISPIGVTMIERSGVHHLIDWVGQSHYPNVADFLEEVRVAGLSRRLPKTLDFAKLTAESRLLTVHARAWIDDDREDAWPDWCPCSVDLHMAGEGAMCAGLWWQDVEGGDPVEGPETIGGRPAPPDRMVLRSMPAFRYRALRRPDDCEPKYRPAMFASWPISRLAVVKDPFEGKHHDAVAAARQSSLDVDEVDE